MQARLFSYLDTQLTRLGGPNFTQLPINRPHCPVNDMLRDGMHQTADPHRPRAVPAEQHRRRRARSSPTDGEGGYVQIAAAGRGTAVRAAARRPSTTTSPRPTHVLPQPERRSSRPTSSRRSPSSSASVYEQAIKERELAVLANIDADLCAQVAAGLGLPAPDGHAGRGRARLAGAVADRRPTPGPIAGRKIGVIADAGSDLAGISEAAQVAATGSARRVLVIAPVGGVLEAGARQR